MGQATALVKYVSYFTQHVTILRYTLLDRYFSSKLSPKQVQIGSIRC